MVLLVTMTVAVIASIMKKKKDVEHVPLTTGK
jgi:hypothetical protein